MTRLPGAQRLPLPGLIGGLIQDADAGTPTAIADGENFIPEPAGRQVTRGGSREMLTLSDATPTEVDHVGLIQPLFPPGALAIGFSAALDKHYVWALTADIAFSSGAEATSRTVLPATWDSTETASAYGTRPVAAILFEKLYVCDARTAYASRKTFLGISGATPPVATEPTFAFGSGGAQAIRPFCLEAYNSMLVIAGYGSEDASDADRPELLRHSFLGTAPDAANGFQKDAWLILGAKGDRVTALRAGRGLLLAAKQNELYRITGSGRALPGWQLAVEGVDNPLGLGIANPKALAYGGDGYWYGIGKSGPLRTDGYAVESLRGPRQRGWRALDQITDAWVTVHPERRLILFGMHETEVGGVSYPNVIWAWDQDRNVWAPNWRVTTTRFFMAAPVATDSAVGPTAPPSAPTATSITTSGWTGGFTAGDTTAETEWWIKEGAGGTWVLQQVLPPADVSEAVTGKLSHTEYFQKFRHRKNGVPSAFTAEQSVKTLISAPTLGVGCFGYDGQAFASVFQTCPGTITLVLESSPAGAGTWGEVGTTPGPGNDFAFVFFNNASTDYRAKARDLSWPTTESVPSATANLGPCA